MSKIFSKIMVAGVALALCAPIQAQNLESGYFLEGNTYRHEMNPAFAGESNYVAMPGMGNLNLSIGGTLNLDAFLRKQNNGKLGTYLSPDISFEDAMSRFKSNNKLNVDLKEQILGFGFKGFGGYNTIGINARAMVGLSLPKELFAMTKQLENKDYRIGDIDALALGYAELALGHSRQINENLRIGAKLKFLVGAGMLDAKVTDLRLDLSGDSKWTASGRAEMNASVKGLQYVTEEKEYKNGGKYRTVTDIDMDDYSNDGFGMALDLGAEYDMNDLVEGLKLSASVLDLGYIGFSTNMQAVNNGKPFEFDGFHNVKIKDSEGTKLSDQTDELADKVTDLIRLNDKGDQGSRSRMLGATVNVGAEYALPAYDKLRFGLLSTTKLQGKYSWNEERLSVNVAPIYFVDANVNVGVGTYGASFGWMLNFHPTGFNFFVGMDHMMGKMTKQYVPLKSTASFAMGVNFTFNKTKKEKKAQRVKVKNLKPVTPNESGEPEAVDEKPVSNE